MDDATPLVSGLDHVEFAVTDLDTRVGELVTRYGFDVAATSTVVASHRFATGRQGDISLVLTQGIAEEHPASCYVRAHGDGVTEGVVGVCRFRGCLHGFSCSAALLSGRGETCAGNELGTVVAIA